LLKFTACAIFSHSIFAHIQNSLTFSQILHEAGDEKEEKSIIFFHLLMNRKSIFPQSTTNEEYVRRLLGKGMAERTIQLIQFVLKCFLSLIRFCYRNALRKSRMFLPGEHTHDEHYYPYYFFSLAALHFFSSYFSTLSVSNRETFCQSTSVGCCVLCSSDRNFEQITWTKKNYFNKFLLK
jgi:hypothetical protein